MQTRSGHDIENLQAWELTNLEWSQVNETVRKYPGAVFLAGPCPVYNCHGLSLASRRTQLCPDTADFMSILQRDDYERVDESEANVGDLVFYFDQEDGSIIHSGIVVGRESLCGSRIVLPRIWSKWGHGHEVVHSCNISPYSPSERQYYRMKSWQRH